MSKLVHASLVSIIMAVAASRGDAPPADGAKEMVEAARAFLDALPGDLRERAALDFDAPERRDWHYVPRAGHGVALQSLDAGQRLAAHSLLRSGLSTAGYLKASSIFHLEELIRRDPEIYRFAIFGEPGHDGPWGWRVEGHHLSLTFTVIDGSAAVASPAFFGSEPSEVRDGPYAGLRVLAREEELARRLLASLDDAQRAAAIIADRAPRDIIMSPGRDAWPEPSGVAHAQLSDAQRALLVQLVQEYVHNLRADVAEAQLARIAAAGLDDIRFAWAGGEERGEGHYYRVQGPTFILEYDNVQSRANHAHSVWRDRDNDFGGDLLRAHYEAAHPDEVPPSVERGERHEEEGSR